MSIPAMPAWLEAMFPAGMRRRMVDVGGVRMHVAEWGDGPTVVLLHGNPSWALVWRKVVAELIGDGLRLVVPDLIGLGLSDKPRGLAAHTLAAHRTWVARCLDVVAPGDVYFVGQDWGGPIGLLALADRMAQVRGVVLLNTVIGPPRPGFKPTTFHRLAQTPIVSDLLFRLVGVPQAGMSLVQGDKRGLIGKPVLGYLWPLRHLRDRAAPLALARMVPDSLDHPSIPLLERCRDVMVAYRGPVSAVWGMRDPVLGRVISWIEQQLPRAHVVRTEAGHFLQEEVPGPIAEEIRDVVGARVELASYHARVATTVRFAVLDADGGVRLDQVLARQVPGLSRRKARVLIDIGGVFVDRARVKAAGRMVRTGQVVEANLGGALDRAGGTGKDARARADAALPPYRIVHEDEHVIVVDKPAGLVTAPTPESDRGNLLDLLARRDGGGPVFLVHRIDLPTSGLLVFARTDLANRALGARFAAHDVEREYVTVVAGAVAETLATIDRPVTGRRAVTHVVGREVVAGGRATIVTVRLETGRSHQIRIHLAGAGHPVLGDGQHGGEVSRRFAPAPPRLALHAGVLGFVHPATAEPLRWVSPIPDDLSPWLAALRAEPASPEAA